MATLQTTPAVLLTWTDNATNETGFQVMSSVNGGTFAQVAAPGPLTGTGSVSWTDTTVLAGNTYTYQVRAINASGSSAYSNTVTVTVPVAGGLPATPTGLTAAITSSTQVTLSWIDTSNNQTSFAVWRSVNGGTYAQVATVTRTAAESTATGGAVTYVNTGLTAGTTYNYYVRAVNAVGRSNTSNLVTVNFTGIPTGPAAPTALVATVQVGPAVLLTWTDNATNETGFQVERFAINGGAFTQIAAPGPSATSSATYTDTAVTAGNTYGYRVEAVNGTGISAYSNTATAATSGTTPRPRPLRRRQFLRPLSVHSTAMTSMPPIPMPVTP